MDKETLGRHEKPKKTRDQFYRSGGQKYHYKCTEIEDDTATRMVQLTRAVKSDVWRFFRESPEFNKYLIDRFLWPYLRGKVPRENEIPFGQFWPILHNDLETYDPKQVAELEKFGFRNPYDRVTPLLESFLRFRARYYEQKGQWVTD